MKMQTEYIVSEMGPPQSLNLDQLLTEGKRLLAVGDKPAALEQLLMATDIAPESETAWVLRAKATEDRQETIASLERVLYINPENAQAREELLYLRMNGLQQGVRGITNTVAVAEPGAGVGALVGRLLSRPIVRFGLGVGILAFFSLACLALVLVGRNLSPKAQPVAQDVSSAPVFLLPPTRTPVPSRTATRTPKPSPTPSGKAKISLTVRAGPGTNFARLGAVPQDTIFAIIGRSPDSKYIAIAYPDADKTGWVLTDSMDLGGADVDALAVTAPPPTAQAPTRPAVAAVRASDTPLPLSPWIYTVNPRGCQHSGGTYIEGIVRNSYGEEANARVTLGSSPGANVTQTLMTGSERSPGYYTFVLNRDGLSPGTYYVWIMDASGKILSDPNAARVNISDAGNCWQAFVDFVRR